MTKTQFLAAFEEATFSDPGSVEGSQALATAEGWDSLGMLSLQLALSKNFDIVLTADQIKQCLTIGDLADAVGASG